MNNFSCDVCLFSSQTPSYYLAAQTSQPENKRHNECFVCSDREKLISLSLRTRVDRLGCGELVRGSRSLAHLAQFSVVDELRAVSMDERAETQTIFPAGTQRSSREDFMNMGLKQEEKTKQEFDYFDH